MTLFLRGAHLDLMSYRTLEMRAIYGVWQGPKVSGAFGHKVGYGPLVVVFILSWRPFCTRSNPIGLVWVFFLFLNIMMRRSPAFFRGKNYIWTTWVVSYGQILQDKLQNNKRDVVSTSKCTSFFLSSLCWLILELIEIKAVRQSINPIPDSAHVHRNNYFFLWW